MLLLQPKIRTSTVPVRGCATAVLVTRGRGVGEAVERAIGFGRGVAVGSAPGAGVSIVITDGDCVGPAGVVAGGFGVVSWPASGVSISMTDELCVALGAVVGATVAAGLASSPAAGDGVAAPLGARASARTKMSSRCSGVSAVTGTMTPSVPSAGWRPRTAKRPNPGPYSAARRMYSPDARPLQVGSPSRSREGPRSPPLSCETNSKSADA
jgi:hypothetical protein